MPERDEMFMFKQSGKSTYVIDPYTGRAIGIVARDRDGTSLNISPDVAKRLEAMKPLDQSLPDFIVKQAKGNQKD